MALAQGKQAEQWNNIHMEFHIALYSYYWQDNALAENC